MPETPQRQRRPNQHIILEDHAQIIITQPDGTAHVARLDLEDFHRLKHLHFSVRKMGANYYAVTTVKGQHRYLHRMVFPFSLLVDGKPMVIHHTLSGENAALNTLDCRKARLRHLHRSEHQRFHNDQRRLRKLQLG